MHEVASNPKLKWLLAMVLTWSQLTVTRAEADENADDATSTLSNKIWICQQGAMTYGRSIKWNGCPCEDSRLNIKSDGTLRISCKAQAPKQAEWKVKLSKQFSLILSITYADTSPPDIYELSFLWNSKRMMHIVTIADGLADQQRYFNYEAFGSRL